MSRKALSSVFAEQTGFHHLVTKSGSSSRMVGGVKRPLEVFPEAWSTFGPKGTYRLLLELRPVDE